MRESTNENEICDRLHAIHQTESRITACRYFPQSLSRLQLPLLVPLPGAAVYEKEGTHAWLIRRVFNLYAAIGDWSAGVPTETAQRNGEMMFAVIQDLYLFNDRLRIGNQPKGLNGVVSAGLRSDVGLVDRGGKATQIFALEVEYRVSKINPI